MSYKISKFNYIWKGKDYVVYNFYTGKYIILSETDYENYFNNLGSKELNNDKTFIELVRQSFIVEENNDEEILAKEKIYNHIYDSTLELTIMTTEQCNFRCKYCYEKFEKGNMSEGTIKSIIQFLKLNIVNYKALNIKWFGGEPLLNLYAIEEISKVAIELCKKTKKKFYASITTNGYLLTEEVFEMLIKYHVYSIQITIDGVARIHDKYRVLVNGEPTFDKIIRNIINIKNNDSLKKCLLNIRTNVTEESVAYLEEYVKFMRDKIGFSKFIDFFFRPVGNWGGDRIKEFSDSLMSMQECKFIDKVQSCGLNLNACIYFLQDSLCYAAKKNGYVIGTDGLIYKCTVAFDEDINNLGYLNSNGQMIIDSAKAAKWIINDSKSEKCDKCFASCNCYYGACPINRMKNKVVCPYFMFELDDIMNLIYRKESREYGTQD